MEKKENNTQKDLFYSIEREVAKAPTFIEIFKGQNPWIQQGIDNLYSQEIIRLYLNSSSLHSALINKEMSMTAGQGFNKENLSGPALNFIKNRFSDDTLDTVAYKCGGDLFLQGGFYIKVCWSKDRKTISRITHIPYEKVRISKPIIKDGQLEERKFYVSRDWTNYRRAENTPIEFCEFNPLKNEEQAEQILFVKQYTPGAEYYSLPKYSSNLNYIKLAYEISVFHLKGIQNGFNASSIITFIGPIPDKKTRDANYLQLKERYAGADVSGDLVVLYGQSQETAPVITPMQSNNSDERFKDLVQSVNDNILIAHGASPTIGGIATAGKLGAANEVLEAYQIFQNTVITPAQKMLEDCFSRLASFNGIVEEFKLNNFTILTTESVDADKSAGEKEEKVDKNVKYN